MRKKKRSKRANIRQKGGGFLSKMIQDLCRAAGLQAHDMYRSVYEICRRLNAALQRGKPDNGNGAPVVIQRVLPVVTERKDKILRFFFICNGKEGQIALYQREMISLL